MTDLWLAIIHHVLVFGLAMMLAGEAILLRKDIASGTIVRIARLDVVYGATAGLILVVGVLRVIYGAKGHVYYLGNVWFWAKMASFVLVGLLSVPPTLRFLAWRKALKADSGFMPEAKDLARVLFLIRAEILLLIAVIGFAAAMARYTRF
jgi:putative membrane protein